METLDPNLIGNMALLGGIAVAMLWLGGKTRMLEPRRSTLRCPSCRRAVRRGTVCPCAH